VNCVALLVEGSHDFDVLGGPELLRIASWESIDSACSVGAEKW